MKQSRVDRTVTYRFPRGGQGWRAGPAPTPPGQPQAWWFLEDDEVTWRAFTMDRVRVKRPRRRADETA